MTQPAGGSAAPRAASDPDVVTSGFIVLGALASLVALRVIFRAGFR